MPLVNTDELKVAKNIKKTYTLNPVKKILKIIATL
nr:hypothetical protein [Mucilaginibacter sp. X5P1]